jgi:tRNA threonylcarbamoyladenosine biosynthesis protein TsaE
VPDPVTSPAFVLVRSYEGRLPMVHLDVYRLDRLQELVDLGISELLDEDGVTLIEWGDVVTPALPSDFLEVRLEAGESDDERIVELRTVGAAWSPRVRAIREAVDRWAAGT